MFQNWGGIKTGLIKGVFQQRLNELEKIDPAKHRNLVSELLEWSSAIAHHLGGSGTLGDLVEVQVRYISQDIRKGPRYIINAMFDDYIKGNDYAFVSLFHH